MNIVPFIPDNAPFTAEQRVWLNGYLAGLFTNARGEATPAAPAVPAKPLLVLYGSQTGTAEQLAKKTAKAAASKGFAPKVVGMEEFDSVDLAQEEHVLVITSTYGDGEPPDNAQGFWNWLSSDTAPRLERTHFSVLALGDTNYPAFCEFGKRCDTRFESLGAKRVHPRIDCDVDYEMPAKTWTDGVFTALTNGANGGDGTVAEGKFAIDHLPSAIATGYSRKNPFPARLLANRKLTSDDSGKEVRHFEISLAESGLTYEAGDALGVLPSNDPLLVGDLLKALGFDGEEAVAVAEGGELPLRLALAQHYDITKPGTDLLKAMAERNPGGDLALLLDPARREDLKKFLWGREVIDFVTSLATPFTPVEFVKLLKKQQPRLYSISSSPNAHPGEVHLTVGTVRHNSHGRTRGGVCSTFLADRAGADTPVPVFVQPSHGFKLPADLTRPVIMVGPGTGIAPFRAFLQERAISGASGKNWLFFGDQRRATDFLYREQVETWHGGGHLARLDLAFSRDQAEKIYVQHRMIEAAAELWAWLEAGAYFYVCGDASRMAKDVDAALHQIIETGSGQSKDAAAAYVARLKLEKRYQRDVY